MSELEQSLLELIRRTSTELSDDVVAALKRAHRGEDVGTNGRFALDQVLESIRLAFASSLPLSQHTSSIQFYLSAPPRFDLVEFEKSARRLPQPP